MTKDNKVLLAALNYISDCRKPTYLTLQLNFRKSNLILIGNRTRTRVWGSRASEANLKLTGVGYVFADGSSRTSGAGGL
jgi:hypothetical protein